MLTNWAGNYTYRATHFREATTIAAAQEIVAAARNVRVLGSRHSFNSIADSDGTLISLSGLSRVLNIDPGMSSVTVEGGIRYGDLAPVLHQNGLALSNLASLPHISVAGAVATATHGSGSRTGNLATSVTAIDIIDAKGDIVTYARDVDPDLFSGAVVNLGALGPVVRMTLKVEPTYEVRQYVYSGLTNEMLITAFDEIFELGKSVSIFTDWCGGMTNAVWVKEVVAAGSGSKPPDAEIFGAKAAMRNTHPLPDGRAADSTPQLGVPGPWYERLPHFRMGYTPSNGAEIQAEYFMPREVAAKAIKAMSKHGERFAGVLMISEVRTIAGDDLWLSPGSRGPYFAIHFTFRRHWSAVCKILLAIEADLSPLGAVPHWGKVTTMSPAQVAMQYSRMADFRDLVVGQDAKGKFRNDFISQFVFAVGET